MSFDQIFFISWSLSVYKWTNIIHSFVIPSTLWKAPGCNKYASALTSSAAPTLFTSRIDSGTRSLLCSRGVSPFHPGLSGGVLHSFSAMASSRLGRGSFTAPDNVGGFSVWVYMAHSVGRKYNGLFFGAAQSGSLFCLSYNNGKPFCLRPLIFFCL